MIMPTAPFLDGWVDNSVVTDTATGLGNMFALLQAIKLGLEEIVQEPGCLLSLVLLDVDDFGAINRQIGEEASSYMLKTIATTLYRMLNELTSAEQMAMLFRVSADELALLVRHHDCAQVQELTRKLQRGVQAIRWEKFPSPVTLSASMACFPSCASSMGDLLTYTNLFMTKTKSHEPGGITCPGSREHQNEQQLSVELHNNATALVESLSNKVLDTAIMLNEAQQMAYTDPTTLLPNLRAARAQLASMLAYALEKKQPFGVMLVDGDRLYEYNQLFGYAAGNEMIYWLGQRLRQLADDRCFVARWLSGDEFVILCPNIAKNECLELAERLRKGIMLQSQELRLPITVSIGVSGFPEDGYNSEQLINAMETANKRAKQSGRNRVSLY